MSDTRYTKAHLWLRSDDDDGLVTVGITQYAQDELGDVVYVEPPELDEQFAQGQDVAVVESVKTASDIAMPISGTVVAVNERLADEPELINASPEDEAWLFRIRPESDEEPEDALDEDGYAEYIKGL